MAKSMDLLKDKVCLVTGGSKGIGKAIVERFILNGAIVYSLASTKDSFRNSMKHENIIEIVQDLNDRKKLNELILKIRREQGQLDVLVNNAAVEFNEVIGMISNKNMEEMFNVNVFAPIDLIQLSSRLMARKKTGSIVNITSLVGEKGNIGQLVYSATKGAMMAVTKSAAKELAKNNIRVNAVAPGLTDTDMLKQVDTEAIQQRIDNILLGKLAKPTDIANAVLFLSSDLSSHVSGQILNVDGCTLM